MNSRQAVLLSVFFLSASSCYAMHQIVTTEEIEQHKNRFNKLIQLLPIEQRENNYKTATIPDPYFYLDLYLAHVRQDKKGRWITNKDDYKWSKSQSKAFTERIRLHKDKYDRQQLRAQNK